MYKNVLQKSGLSEGEADIYDILLQYGDSPASEITSKTSHKRGMVYKYLKDLKKRGLVSTFSKNKKTYFRPEHPYKLMTAIESNLREAKTQEASLEAALPQLISTFSTLENKPGVRVFEGIAGIKEIYKDTLRDKNEIWAILQASQVEPKLYKWLTDNYVKQRVKENIWAKVLVAQDKKSHTQEYIKKSEEEKREVKILHKSKFPVAIEIDIYGDKVAFMNFKKGEQNIGILINNKLIADTMRALFLIAWSSNP